MSNREEQQTFERPKGYVSFTALQLSCSMTACVGPVRCGHGRPLISRGANGGKIGACKQSFCTFLSLVLEGLVTRNSYGATTSTSASAAAAAAAFLLPPQRIIPTARLIAKRGNAPSNNRPIPCAPLLSMSKSGGAVIGLQVRLPQLHDLFHFKQLPTNARTNPRLPIEGRIADSFYSSNSMSSYRRMTSWTQMLLPLHLLCFHLSLCFFVHFRVADSCRSCNPFFPRPAARQLPSVSLLSSNSPSLYESQL